MPKVCIILPVLNERDNIDPLLTQIEAAMASRPYVVCIVDDGSADGTREYLEEAKAKTPDRYHLIYRTKAGRGSQRGSALYISMLWGLQDEDNDTFVEMDGDLSHRPEELPGGLDALKSRGLDVIIASKYRPGSNVTNRPFDRRLVSRICNTAVRVLLSPRIRDYSNGYRFYNRRAAESVAHTKIRYGSPIYLTEVMGIWLRNRMKMGEIPTTYVGRGEGLSKLRFVDLLKAGVAIFEVGLRYRITGFQPAPAGAPPPGPGFDPLAPPENTK